MRRVEKKTRGKEVARKTFGSRQVPKAQLRMATMTTLEDDYPTKDYMVMINSGSKMLPIPGPKAIYRLAALEIPLGCAIVCNLLLLLLLLLITTCSSRPLLLLLSLRDSTGDGCLHQIHPGDDFQCRPELHVHRAHEVVLLEQQQCLTVDLLVDKVLRVVRAPRQPPDELEESTAGTTTAAGAAVASNPFMEPTIDGSAVAVPLLPGCTASVPPSGRPGVPGVPFCTGEEI
uniref:Uncharacterized protein n=1 Tax=Anopheles atroparvus TaxID=41427 RepID=A0A182J1S8_ANOAO